MALIISVFIILMLQALLKVVDPGRDTQDLTLHSTSAILTTYYVYSIYVTRISHTYTILRFCSQLVYPSVTNSMEDVLLSILKFLATGLSMYIYYCIKDPVCVLLIYVIWLLRWITFLVSIGKLLDDLRMVSRVPHTRTRPKRNKHRKVRRKRLPFYKRSQIRTLLRSSRLNNNKLIQDSWGIGWCDDGDPLQGCHSLPYWRVLHTSVLPDVWDSICKINPDIVSMILGGDDSMIQSGHLGSNHRLLNLAFHSGSSVLDLTDATSTSNLFRFHSVFHVQDMEHGAPIVFDSGASTTITPYKSDFVEGVNTNPDAIGSSQILGIGANAAVKGVGRIRLSVYTDSGAKREIITDALYVPDARIRLLSVCRYREEYSGQGCSFLLDDFGCTFTFPKSQGGGKITFDYRGDNYIPKTTAYSQRFGKSASRQDKNAFMILDNSNVNLTAAQKELLKWHFCLGHFNMRWIQRLITKKVLSVTENNVTSKNAICNCMACTLAKQTRRPEGTVKQTIRDEKDGNLKKGILRPGSMISSDQFVSSLPGRLPNTYGREKDSEKYVGGTIFIDEASGYFSVHNQVSLNAEETIRSKHSFEREAIRHGVPVLGYRADNGIYRSEKFRGDLKHFGQTIQFCGVGAHHHNGVAERGIRTVSTAARAIMLHAMIHWPEHVSLDLWPFAIKYAVYLWNRIPNDSGLSPMELFYDTKSDHQQLRASKVWGCPAYVLDPRIQDGKKIPRWNPRSKLG